MGVVDGCDGRVCVMGARDGCSGALEALPPVVPVLRYVQYAQGRMSVGKGQTKPFYTGKRPLRCSDADDQPGSREATVVFETGLPGNVTR